MTELAEGTEITCPLCREEATTVKRNKQDKPYFYCAEYEAAVNMNAPVAHSESFLREFVVSGETGGAGGAGGGGSGGAASGGGGAETADSTDITTREE